ncbi:HAD hydrolase family protein [Kiloniella sp. EL199]|uniref:HAD hydrolase family protein n=1 Tax=Kiloniella sp. EL199 TaxID=2107581 RepID=UPI0013C4D391|nr:HAD hydrolase family protein [Kiloniella sp. EL199]
MKLYISDLDFTLLDTIGDLPKSSVQRLNRLIEQGVHFTIATARAAPSIKHLMENVNLQLPIIELNGAIIRDLNTNHVLDHKGLGLNNAIRAFDCFQELDLIPYVSGLRGDNNPLYFPELKNKGMQWFHDEKVIRHDPRLSELPLDLLNNATSDTSQNYKIQASPLLDDVLCFVYLGSKEEIFTIKSLIEEKLPHLLITLYPNHYIGGWEIIVSAPEANKGFAVKSLLGHIKERHSFNIEEITAFGDSSNDLDMLRNAHTPIAVANASKEIKAEAHKIIGHHGEEAVLSYIEEMHS